MTEGENCHKEARPARIAKKKILIFQNVACTRCHKDAKGIDKPEHTRPAYPAVGNRFDFKALSYEGDPVVTGSRF